MHPVRRLGFPLVLIRTLFEERFLTPKRNARRAAKNHRARNELTKSLWPTKSESSKQTALFLRLEGGEKKDGTRSESSEQENVRAASTSGKPRKGVTHGQGQEQRSTGQRKRAAREPDYAADFVEDELAFRDEPEWAGARAVVARRRVRRRSARRSRRPGRPGGRARVRRAAEAAHGERDRGGRRRFDARPLFPRDGDASRDGPRRGAPNGGRSRIGRDRPLGGDPRVHADGGVRARLARDGPAEARRHRRDGEHAADRGAAQADQGLQEAAQQAVEAAGEEVGGLRRGARARDSLGGQRSALGRARRGDRPQGRRRAEQGLRGGLGRVRRGRRGQSDPRREGPAARRSRRRRSTRRRSRRSARRSRARSW